MNNTHALAPALRKALKDLAAAKEQYDKHLATCQAQAREIIRGVCAELGLSQSQMARELQRDQNNISAVAIGNRKGGADLWVALHKLLAQQK